MDDKSIELPPKKPYTRPQLHELTSPEADGKAFPTAPEVGLVTGPS